MTAYRLIAFYVFISFSSHSQRMNPAWRYFERQYLMYELEKLEQKDKMMTDSLVIQEKKIDSMLQNLKISRLETTRYIDSLRAENDSLQKVMDFYQEQMKQIEINEQMGNKPTEKDPMIREDE